MNRPADKWSRMEWHLCAQRIFTIILPHVLEMPKRLPTDDETAHLRQLVKDAVDTSLQDTNPNAFKIIVVACVMTPLRCLIPFLDSGPKCEVTRSLVSAAIVEAMDSTAGIKALITDVATRAHHQGVDEALSLAIQDQGTLH